LQTYLRADIERQRLFRPLANPGEVEASCAFLQLVLAKSQSVGQAAAAPVGGSLNAEPVDCPFAIRLNETPHAR
jgi:hypothetical protein